jgi:hypothetical protein
MTHSADSQGTTVGLTDDFVALSFPSQSFPDLDQRLGKYLEKYANIYCRQHSVDT